MTGILRILIFILFGYIIIKSIKYFVSIFTAVKESKEEKKVYETARSKSKIDKKDVIDAQFEEIDVKEDQSSEKK
jgi:sortase (surface protein transpeptidase)